MTVETESQTNRDLINPLRHLGTHANFFPKYRTRFTFEPRLVTITSIFNMLVVLPRFLPGIPTGVDSPSHLYKAIFSYKSLVDFHYISARAI
jgi:hypothetical protein